MRLKITKPVVDLLSEPARLPPNDYSHNDLRMTQLLFNDEVELIEERGEWLFVGALAQQCFRENLGWHSYRGWIHSSEATQSHSPPPTHVVSTKMVEINGLKLSYGTLLHVEGDKVILPTGQKVSAPLAALRCLSNPFSHDQLIKDATHFLDDPYLWGGTAAYGSHETASLDCSGLIYLLYRAQGIFLPRDAHDQWMKSKPISKDNLRRGDLLFLAREDRPNRISHVLLYHGDNHLMEAPQTNEKVRLVPMQTDLTYEENFIRIKGREKRYFPHFRRVEIS